MNFLLICHCSLVFDLGHIGRTKVRANHFHGRDFIIAGRRPHNGVIPSLLRPWGGAQTCWWVEFNYTINNIASEDVEWMVSIELARRVAMQLWSINFTFCIPCPGYMSVDQRQGPCWILCISLWFRQPPPQRISPGRQYCYISFGDLCASPRSHRDSFPLPRSPLAHLILQRLAAVATLCDWGIIPSFGQLLTLVTKCLVALRWDIVATWKEWDKSSTSILFALTIARHLHASLGTWVGDRLFEDESLFFPPLIMD